MRFNETGYIAQILDAFALPSMRLCFQIPKPTSFDQPLERPVHHFARDIFCASQRRTPTFGYALASTTVASGGSVTTTDHV